MLVHDVMAMSSSGLMLVVHVPSEQMGLLIGKKGRTRARLMDTYGVHLEIPYGESVVHITGERGEECRCAIVRLLAPARIERKRKAPATTAGHHRPVCRFFLAGECLKDNCRFWHVPRKDAVRIHIWDTMHSHRTINNAPLYAIQNETIEQRRIPNFTGIASHHSF